MGRRRDSNGRVTTNGYPHPRIHGLGLPSLLELLGNRTSVDDLDDHQRLSAGYLLLGLNLAMNKNAGRLDLTRSFTELDF